ncbi:MAG TPA: hypothetical protein ENK18_06485 [Deltaproteobacteria bacterium]|nr:hypothetical protein [Deltaproteobacteria bacterium]
MRRIGAVVLIAAATGCADDRLSVVSVSAKIGQEKIAWADFDGSPRADFVDPLPPEVTSFELYIIPRAQPETVASSVSVLDEMDRSYLEGVSDERDRWYYDVDVAPMPPGSYRLELSTELRRRSGANNAAVQIAFFEIAEADEASP